MPSLDRKTIGFDPDEVPQIEELLEPAQTELLRKLVLRRWATVPGMAQVEVRTFSDVVRALVRVGLSDVQRLRAEMFYLESAGTLDELMPPKMIHGLQQSALAALQTDLSHVDSVDTPRGH